MCYNCGCQNPLDNMGSDDNITEKTLIHLSEHWNKSLGETKEELFNLLQSNDPKLEEDRDLQEMFTKAAKVFGQSVEEAKNETHKLLKRQLKK